MKIGVIGVGHLGNFHLKQLVEIPEISVSGLYDIDLKRAEAMSRNHKIPYFPNLESLLDASDAVSVVTPTRSHYKITDQALDAGEGLLRLTPTWVPRSFLHPGRRLRLHPDDEILS